MNFGGLPGGLPVARDFRGFLFSGLSLDRIIFSSLSGLDGNVKGIIGNDIPVSCVSG